MAYSTPQDVYALGLPPEAFARPPRPLEGVTAGSGLLLLRSHGLALDAPVTFALLSSSIPGAAASVLPAGLTAGVAFFAAPVTSDSFRVATSAGGTPIASFASAGVGLFGVLVDHEAYLIAAIAAADTLIDAHARAHKAPLQAAILRMVSAFLAARIYIAAHAFGNPAFAAMAEPPPWILSLIDRLFGLWVSGSPLPAGSSDATPIVVENQAVVIELDGRGFLDADDGGRA